MAPASIEPAEVTFLKRLRPAPQPSGFGLGKFKLPDPMLDIAKLRAFAARPC